MEEFQKDYINKNLPDLLEATNCSVSFLVKLRADGLLSDEEVNIVSNIRNNFEAAKKFYDIIQTRSNSYNFLKQALEKTCQSGALSILDRCNDANSSTPYKHYGTISYTTKTVLGRGCHSTIVYKGKFEDRDVAVKVINRQFIEVQKALKEVDFLKQLDWHENVVRYFRRKITEDFVLIAMELCDVNLHDWVTKTKSLGIAALEVIRQATEGMAHLHSNKIVHMDLNPANILLVSHIEGNVLVKISDFGMSKKILDGRSRVSVDTSGLGTEGWMAPEVIMQVLNANSSNTVHCMEYASDIFSLGCIFYFVVTDGIHPFGDPFRRQGNILDGNLRVSGRTMTSLETGSSEIKKLIKDMIAHNHFQRPSIDTVKISLTDEKLKEPSTYSLASRSRAVFRRVLSLPRRIHFSSDRMRIVSNHDIAKFLDERRLLGAMTSDQGNGARQEEEIDEFWNGRSSDVRVAYNSIEPYDMDNSIECLYLTYDTSFELPKTSFKIQGAWPLGAGQFGIVCRGTVTTARNEIQEVAVKMVRPPGTHYALKGMLEEIKILAHVGKHPHVIELIGAYTAEIKNGKIFLFLELCTRGSLQSQLRGYSREDLMSQEEVPGTLHECTNVPTTRNQLYMDLSQWSKEIAKGMEYIASKNIVHRDVATRNVLLTEDNTAKITDFGLSSGIFDDQNYIKTNKNPLPWRWMAPESLKRSEFTEKSDVWGFGILLWEMYSFGDIPYPGLSWDINFVSKLEKGLRLGKPSHSIDNVYSVMLRCWDMRPDRRPTFTELIRLLDTQEYVPYYGSSELERFTLAQSEYVPNPKKALETTYRIELPKKCFKIMEEHILGIGVYGTVCLGTIVTAQNGTQEVAVKMNKPPGPKTALDGMLNEIRILSLLGNHPNVIQLLGSYTAKLKKGKVFMFLEFCALGSLQGYLRKYKTEKLNENITGPGIATGLLDEDLHEEYQPIKVDKSFTLDMARWSYEIANAMEFIASKHIVYVDLGARNIFLTEGKQAKIADFGLSRYMYDNQTYVKKYHEPLPWRWMAPESLKRSEFTEKSDVWTFGILLWEMYNFGDEPYPGLSRDVNFASKLERGLRPGEPSHNPNNIYSMMLRCWDMKPDQRPRFACLKASLDRSEDDSDEFPAYAIL